MNIKIKGICTQWNVMSFNYGISYFIDEICSIKCFRASEQFSINNGNLFMLNAVGKSEKFFPNERGK